MNIKLNRNFNDNAFRIWLSTNFIKEDLKKLHLRASTVKKVYFILCGIITPKNPVIFNKSVEYIARTSCLCKEATLKALKFLEEYRFIRITKGRGRLANSYQNFLKETGIKVTKNFKALPYMNFKDHIILKDLAANKTVKGTNLSVLNCLLVHAGIKNNIFLASKETVEYYTQLDRRTINKAFKALEAAGIIEKTAFPISEEGKKSPYNRGQTAYKVNRKKLEFLCAGQLAYKKPKPKTHQKEKTVVEYGAPDGWLDDFLNRPKKTG